MDANALSRRIDRSVAGWLPTVVRVTAGVLWLSNVSWKIPPNFGESGGKCGGFCKYLADGADHPVVPGSAWVFDTIIRPNVTAFGWLTLFVEAGLAAALLSGRFVRVAAVVGVAQSVGIGLAVANADGEWYWSYGLMIALHLAILAMAPGMRTVPPRVMGACAAGYGAIVALAHTSGGLTGDRSFTLFEQANDFPGDFGRNLFPGSIALGILFIALGAAVWVASSRSASILSVAGYALVGVSAVLLLTYGSDGLLLRLGSRATTAAVVAAVGLSLSAALSGPSTRTDDERATPTNSARARRAIRDRTTGPPDKPGI